MKWNLFLKMNLETYGKKTKKHFLIIFVFLFVFFLLVSSQVNALPTGTLLYKTGTQGKMYGLNEFRFSPFFQNIHLGGVGIYLGEIEGEPTVAEVSSGRVRL